MSVWITRLSQIPEADEDSLKRSLITEDGVGKVMKEAVVQELLRRRVMRPSSITEMPNDQAQGEPPDRNLSAQPEPPRGGDALKRVVRETALRNKELFIKWMGHLLWHWLDDPIDSPGSGVAGDKLAKIILQKLPAIDWQNLALPLPDPESFLQVLEKS